MMVLTPPLKENWVEREENMDQKRDKAGKCRRRWSTSTLSSVLKSVAQQGENKYMAAEKTTNSPSPGGGVSKTLSS